MLTARRDVSVSLRRRAGRRRRRPRRCPTGRCSPCSGPSGCGKSTLLRAVAGLEPLAAGTVRWDGADLAGVPTHKRGFALMFQDGQLFAHLTVARNVGYALRLRRRARHRGAGCAELLELVGLAGYGDRLPATLSGGERQRVALARALAVEPRLLLLDEPLSALDAGLRERLADDLRDILRAAGTTALMVTHDHEEAFTVADRLAVMRAGPDRPGGADRRGLARAGRPRDRALPRLRAGADRDAAAAACWRPRAGRPRRRSPYDARPWPWTPTGGLAGEVRSSRATSEQVRLVVDVDGRRRGRRGRSARRAPGRRAAGAAGRGPRAARGLVDAPCGPLS